MFSGCSHSKGGRTESCCWPSTSTCNTPKSPSPAHQGRMCPHLPRVNAWPRYLGLCYGKLGIDPVRKPCVSAGSQEGHPGITGATLCGGASVSAIKKKLGVWLPEGLLGAQTGKFPNSRFRWEGEHITTVFVMQFVGCNAEWSPVTAFCPSAFCVGAVTGHFLVWRWSLSRVTMCDDLVGKESTWPPVLVVQLTVYREKVPATSFCPVKFLYASSPWMFSIFELESAESK